jgi:hypothetical protein
LFILTTPLLWSFTYFFSHIYIILIFSCIIYIIPSVKEIISQNKIKNNNNFFYVTGLDLYWILITPLFLFLLLNIIWVNFTASAWFGNIVFAKFQFKISFLILFFYLIILTAYATSFYFSSKLIYDYVLVNFNFFFWLYFIFTSNSVFTVIFFIEILSTLIFLLIISSTFSTTFFYNNLNLNLHNYFSSTTPFFFIQILMFFFWISLLSSLNLFLFLILFYLKFLTLDWFLFEFIFLYVIELNEVKDVFFLSLIWFNLLFSLFLKCGLAPFYFWKPTFFKGIPLHALFFYISFFYFFIFIFFIFFILEYLNEIFFFFINVNIVLLLLGLFVLLFILCESYYLKTFLALSSVLNTLFVFLTINSTATLDFFL